MEELSTLSAPVSTAAATNFWVYKVCLKFDPEVAWSILLDTSGNGAGFWLEK